jgi:hypothetical protein
MADNQKQKFRKILDKKYFFNILLVIFVLFLFLNMFSSSLVDFDLRFHQDYSISETLLRDLSIFQINWVPDADRGYFNILSDLFLNWVIIKSILLWILLFILCILLFPKENGFSYNFTVFLNYVLLFASLSTTSDEKNQIIIEIYLFWLIINICILLIEFSLTAIKNKKEKPRKKKSISINLIIVNVIYFLIFSFISLIVVGLVRNYDRSFYFSNFIAILIILAISIAISVLNLLIKKLSVKKSQNDS